MPHIAGGAPPIFALKRQPEGHVIGESICLDAFAGGHSFHRFLEPLDTAPSHFDAAICKLLCSSIKHDIARKYTCGLLLCRYLSGLNNGQPRLFRMLASMSQFVKKIEQPARRRMASLLQHDNVPAVYTPAGPVKRSRVVQW